MTHLASAAIHVLHQAVQQADVTLVAPTGTTAQHILTLVAFPPELTAGESAANPT